MNNYIYENVGRLAKKHKTTDPLEILDLMNVVVKESSNYKSLKGYCFMSCQTVYVVINSFLAQADKQIVAAHELGHIILHKNLLKLAPMKDSVLYDMTSKTEYEANLFAADLLLDDDEIEALSHDEDMDYFKMCQCLNTSPDLMSFKLFSLIRRGHSFNMPMGLNSRFLSK